MVRGTTPTLTFTLPFSTGDITDAWVTFAQYGTVKIDKPLSACSCSENKLSVTLTQAETLTLSCDYATEIQLSVKSGNSVFRSKIISVPTERILKDGAI